MKSKIAILLMPFIHSFFFKENLMKSKIAILLMPFIHSFIFKENLMKIEGIAMFNLNSKSTFSAGTTLLVVPQ